MHFISTQIFQCISGENHGRPGQGCLAKMICVAVSAVNHWSFSSPYLKSRNTRQGPHDHCVFGHLGSANKTPTGTHNITAFEIYIASNPISYKFISSYNNSISTSPIRFQKASIFSTVHLSAKIPAFNSFHCLAAMKNHQERLQPSVKDDTNLLEV